MDPLAVTVKVPLALAVTVSQPVPLKVVAVAPTVPPVGMPESCTVWDGGAVPPTGWVKLSEVGAAVMMPEAIVKVTGIVCVGTFVDVLEMTIEPI